jgi:PAS domain S-box-containing protein
MHKSDTVRVMAVTEDADLVALVSDALATDPAVDAQLTTVERLGEALTLAQLRWFDAVLVDARNPDLDAPLTMANLRIAAPRLPIVAVYGEGDDAALRRLLDAGALDVLERSALGADLLAAIRSVMTRYRMVTRLRDAEDRARQAGRAEAESAGRLARESALRVLAEDLLRANEPDALWHTAAQAVATLVGNALILECAGPGGLRRVASADTHGVPVGSVDPGIEALCSVGRAGPDIVGSPERGQIGVMVRNTRGQRAIIVAQRESLDPFTERDAELLRTVAAMLAVAVERLDSALEREAFLDVSPVLYCSLDAADRVRSAAGAWESHLGHPAASLVGRSLLDVVVRDTATIVAAAIGQVRQTRAVRGLEAPCVHADGSTRWMRWTLSADPERDAVRAALVDISAERRIRERLLASQSFETIGRLTGGVAHEFSNAVTTVLGHTDLLLSSVFEPDPRRQDLIEIRRAAETAAALTRQLLAVGRPVATEPAPLDLNARIRDLQDMLRRLAGESITLVLQLAPGLPRVRADVTQIGQILLNLANFARATMPVGGRLTVATRAARAGVGTDTPASPCVVLSMTDTGAGKLSEALAHVFDPLPGGALPSVPLAMAHALVERQGGTIRVHAEPGKGTTFDVYLPAHVAPATTGSATASALPTILVAEDEDGIRTIARRVLERAGYNVLVAASADEAVEIAHAHQGGIRVLLTDLVMPGMAGTELARQLRRDLPDLPVIYMSGYAEDVVRRKLDAEDRAIFLEKPFAPDALLRAVNGVLEHLSRESSTAA